MTIAFRHMVLIIYVIVLSTVAPLFPASRLFFTASAASKNAPITKRSNIHQSRSPYPGSAEDQPTIGYSSGLKHRLIYLSNKYNPEIRRFFLSIFKNLTKNGRGFAIVCAGIQQIASTGRRRHIQALLREKQLKADRAETTKYTVPNIDLTDALFKGVTIYGMNPGSLAKDGWKSAYESEFFSLFKRRVGSSSGSKKGPVQYLMFGSIDNISPRTFLRAQLIKQYRGKWDKTMASMETIKSASSPIEHGNQNSQDMIYYRTRWPWPLKDRDYTLARRTKVFPDRKAIVFVSKSIDYPRAHADGAMRVDKYFCQSIFFSTAKAVPYGRSYLDTPGIAYVTLFCDDTKVSLPSSVIDLISKHAEKTFPSSMNRLFEFCRQLSPS